MQPPGVVGLHGVVGLVLGPPAVELPLEARPDEARADGGAGRCVSKLEVDEESFRPLGEKGGEGRRSAVGGGVRARRGALRPAVSPGLLPLGVLLLVEDAGPVLLHPPVLLEAGLRLGLGLGRLALRPQVGLRPPVRVVLHGWMLDG